MRLRPRTRGGALWRFFLAAVLVIIATAGTTAVAGLLQFKQFAADLNITGPIQQADVNLPPPGAPQTLLVIGSDHRASDPSYKFAHTDTMLLMRLNAASQTINLLSIPRDLQVPIPGFGTSKLNSAYADGGPNLLIKTMQRDVFPGLRVNHIVDVNFGAFQNLVNAIGCVYSDVDHRYYNSTALTGYSSIDIQPGYQKLCGTDQIRGALAFVRFRHSDSDLVRNARQQDFIRWAKDQYGLTNLISNKDTLLRIFGKYAKTDHSLHTVSGLLNLTDLVLNSAGHTIKSIRFPSIPGPCTATTPDCIVTADPVAEQAAFQAFMRATQAPAPAPAALSAPAGGATRAGARRASRVSAAGVTTDTIDGHSQAAALHAARMPVYYPKLIAAGSSYCLSIIGNCDNPQEPQSEYAASYPRHYTIHDQQGRRQLAYYMTLVINPLLGQYYGVQGTTWLHPPILAHPNGFRTVDGKRLELFSGGGKLTDVAWRTRQGVYWVSNTLTNDIGNQQMVAIAASLTRATP